ncbi:translation initiation factor IF-3, mitochondrial [Aricia agestis]|uniref:translation initiation factor IF-3, mitochondrial n=1 Tax=Aricia agestis TaxID=91739 RepID=UPI001C209F0D|nr:translation initiation factor IF-3, mitochondrial [Aricia agestis]
MLKFISILRNFGTASKQIPTRITAEGKEVPKKKVFEERITLIGPDDSLTITDLKNAQNLSSRRDLKLVKIEDADSKSRRPVYKLMTNAQYHEEELQRRKQKQSSRDNVIKGDKLLTLSTKIAQHDLMTRVKKIEKLVGKSYEVRVVINADDPEGEAKLEDVYTTMERNLKSIGRIVQKRNKGNSIRFQVLPPKEDKQGSSSSNQDSNGKGPL